jgi:cysteine synthase A
MKVYSDITKTIGSTPLVKLQRLNQGLKAELFLKLEFFNPLGSVKDRIGLNMIEGAEKSGKLKSGMTVIEPTSGNTGIALAFVCAAKGYPITLVMPETMSQERRTLLLLLGAELILTPGPMGMRGAIAKAMEIMDSDKKYFMPRQFENPDNPSIHEQTTALEIWNDTDGKVDIVVSGVGTGGTITGVGKVLKQKNPNIKMVAVEPTESPVLSGGKPSPHKIQGIGAGFTPPVLNMKIIDSIEQISSEDSLAMAKKVIKTEGIPVGISSGAAISVGLRLAGLEENKGKNIVVIVPSYTERYLSTLLADPERSLAQALVTSTVSEEYLKKVPVQEGV